MVWASRCGVHPIFPFSPLYEQKSERDPHLVSPTAHHPCTYLIHTLRYGCASFSAHLAVVTLTVSVPFHCQFCPMSVSCPCVSIYHSLSLYLYLPHSEFLSARNRSTNHTVPGDLSVSIVIFKCVNGALRGRTCLPCLNRKRGFNLFYCSSYPPHFLFKQPLCTSI